MNQTPARIQVDLAAVTDGKKSCLHTGSDCIAFIEVVINDGSANFGTGVLTVGRRISFDQPLSAIPAQADTTNAPQTITAIGLYGPYDIAGVNDIGVYVSTKAAAQTMIGVVIRSEAP